VLLACQAAATVSVSQTAGVGVAHTAVSVSQYTGVGVGQATAVSVNQTAGVGVGHSVSVGATTSVITTMIERWTAGEGWETGAAKRPQPLRRNARRRRNTEVVFILYLTKFLMSLFQLIVQHNGYTVMNGFPIAFMIYDFVTGLTIQK
jgi:hypothetical protein